VLERLGGSALWGGCFVLALGVALGHLGLERRLTRIREQRLGAAAG
jgi:hypothetical protein